MAKSRRFSTAVLVITTMAVLTITLGLLMWVPLPEEQVFTKLEPVHVGPIRWSHHTLQEAVADVNAQLEKRGETHLRLFVSDAYAGSAAPTVSMDLEDVQVEECARYLAELSHGYMSGSREGITIVPLRCDVPPHSPSWRGQFRSWVKYNLWGRWKMHWDQSSVNPFAPAPGAAPSTAPGTSPAPSYGVDPFAPAGAP